MSHTEDKLAYANDAVVALDQAALSAPAAIPRSGLPNSANRFLREKTGRVAFLGGSITQMEGWSKLIEKDLRSRFPEKEFQFNNAGVGGTNSATELHLFDNYCHRFHRPVFHILAHGLDEGAHMARLRVADRQNPLSTGHAVRVLQFAAA